MDILCKKIAASKHSPFTWNRQGEKADKGSGALAYATTGIGLEC